MFRKLLLLCGLLILWLLGLLGSATVEGITAPPPAPLATPPALAARIERVSGAYLGTPYRLDPLGEGPSGDVDRDPLFDRHRVDCLTFVEQVLAEATSSRPDGFMARLQRIRYRDGVVSFRTRNHYTVTDWLPHNAWLVEDVTEALGGAQTRRMVKIIDHAAFFRSHGCDPAGAGKERSETRYLPREVVPALAERIPSATLVIMVQRRPGIIAAHCGWLLRLPRQPLILRHASSLRGHVVDEPFLPYLARQPHNIAGIKLCIVRGKRGAKMDFPKNKLTFTSIHGGSPSSQGWLVLDIANMDLDGIHKIYVSLEEVDRLRAAGDVQQERLRKARELLGG